MEPTFILAQIWGPILLAVGLGIFVSRNYYNKVYRGLEKESLAVLIFGMLGMAIGIIHVQAHNIWQGLPQIIISLLGWGTLVKGALFAIAPGAVDRGGDWWAADPRRITVAGVLVLVVGAYLSWVGYLV